jgi:cobalt-zinc-cadmium efflux system membrane fusion protein
VIAARQALEARTELQKAQAEVLRASQRLRNLGLDDGQLALLEQEREEDRSRMPITAPLEGVVVSRRAVVGEAVDAASELFTVADLSRMWIHLDVFEKDLRQVRVGQQVIFRVSGLAPAEFPGRVGWIDPQMNDRTRTIRVRAEVENRDGLLRVNMFGRGEIQAGEPRAAWLVPRESVQWEGRSFVVFVEKAADRFEPRRVLTGRYSGPIMELPWADLRPGEQVVTTGSFLLKTEIQKGSIGAGCCGD